MIPPSKIALALGVWGCGITVGLHQALASVAPAAAATVDPEQAQQVYEHVPLLAAVFLVAAALFTGIKMVLSIYKQFLEEVKSLVASGVEKALAVHIHEDSESFSELRTSILLMSQKVDALVSQSHGPLAPHTSNT
jgi:hypothetical protein